MIKKLIKDLNDNGFKAQENKNGDCCIFASRKLYEVMIMAILDKLEYDLSRLEITSINDFMVIKIKD